MRLPTDLCAIRNWRADDREPLLALANNRRVWRNLTHLFPHPYTAADADDWFGHLARGSPVTHWVIEHEGDFAGGIGIFLGEGIHAKSAQIGYWLGEPYWGRGIATAAVRALTAHVIPRYSLCRVEATVFAWNPASARVLEKAGYAREGVLRHSVFKDGEVIDSLLYAYTVPG